jgi:hypothetical protein
MGFKMERKVIGFAHAQSYDLRGSMLSMFIACFSLIIFLLSSCEKGKFLLYRFVLYLATVENDSTRVAGMQHDVNLYKPKRRLVDLIHRNNIFASSVSLENNA